MLIGNDLVDFRTRDAHGKARDGRFVARVFTPGEAARIESSPRADRTLWMLWTGKEAAFKIARKLQPSVPFAHSAYEVIPAVDDVVPATNARALISPAANRINGSVRLHGVQGLDNATFPVEWEVTEAFVHCVAIDASVAHRQVRTKVGSHEELEGGSPGYAPSARELASVNSTESRAVRRLARSLAREAGLGDIEIVREAAGKTFGPPRLYSVGEAEPLEGWDISLSHDGGLAAAALITPATPRR